MCPGQQTELLFTIFESLFLGQPKIFETISRFLGTSSIDYIKDNNGICETKSLMMTDSKKESCRKEEGQWTPYLDISGEENCWLLYLLTINFSEMPQSLTFGYIPIYRFQ